MDWILSILKANTLKSYVTDGERVKKGALLVEFDLEAIKKEGYDLTTSVVVTNISDYIKAVCMEKRVVRSMDTM